jgi:Spy/CpxP family protein refolding chaperone
MRSRKFFVVASAVVLVGFAVVGFLLNGAHNSQPYAGFESRAISSLSEEKIDGLKKSLGLGYALPAELNGFPGPRHVLDFAEQLALTPAQKSQTEALFQSMKSEAGALGERLIIAERQVDQFFKAKGSDETKLFQLTAASAEVEGQLRATHLKYHLAMVTLLQPEQIEAYRKLRGYHPGHDAHTLQ